MKPITKNDILRALSALGLRRGNIVMVHTSLSKIGYVCGGAQAVIEALIETVGEHGTIMMPTQTWKNLDPETGVHGDTSEEDWDTIRENWPAYNKSLTPTNRKVGRRMGQICGAPRFGSRFIQHLRGWFPYREAV